LGRVFEQMKFEHKATIGKGVQTWGSSKPWVGGLLFN
jgi:hypothetical protein